MDMGNFITKFIALCELYEKAEIDCAVYDTPEVKRQYKKVRYDIAELVFNNSDELIQILRHHASFRSLVLSCVEKGWRGER